MESQNRIWLFVNSKVGLLVMGFLLTTVLGALLTHQIEKAVWEHKILLTKLIEDRGIAIRELYQKIVEIEQKFSNIETLVNSETKEIASSVHELRGLFEKSRIYFTPELSGKIGELCDAYEGVLENYNNAARAKDVTIVPMKEIFNTFAAVHQVKVLMVKTKLEEEFRKMLGVD